MGLIRLNTNYYRKVYMPTMHTYPLVITMGEKNQKIVKANVGNDTVDKVERELVREGNFRRLAENRVKRVMKLIEGLGKLSMTNYKHAKQNARMDAICNALIEKIEREIRPKIKTEESGFVLE